MDLIDRNKVLALPRNQERTLSGKVIAESVDVALIEALPSAEAEIIHCKDCKWRNVYQFPPKYDERDYCDKHEKTVSADGFCSWAERRTND